MKSLSSLLLLFVLNSFASPIIKGTANNLDSLVFCYDEKSGMVNRYKVGFFGTGTSPKITLWKIKQQSNCNSNFTAKAEPFAENISEYSFTINNHSNQGGNGQGNQQGGNGQGNQVIHTAKSIDISIQFDGINSPINETIILGNLE